MAENDHTDDISDPTDWLATPLRGLAEVEAALRCQVCKDFYKTPMLTSCNHTFCSVCIRRALNNDGKCPLCRASEQEMRLRSSWSMEEVVASFTRSRADLLAFATKPPSVVLESVERTNGQASPKRPLNMSQDEDERETKRLRSSARLSKTRGAERTAEMARQEADVTVVLPPSRSEPAFHDGLVACPICLARMKETQVDKHLDTSCPGSPQPQPRQAITNSTSQRIAPRFPPQPQRNLERLPALNYSMYKEQALKKKLSELGISTFGPRPMLEKRHKEWMTIWNANCDSLHPRARRELLGDLEEWERTQGARASTMSRSVHIGAQIKDKDFDQAAWATQHESSFKDLIANARRSKSQAHQTSEENSRASGSETAAPAAEPAEPPASYPKPSMPFEGQKLSRGLDDTMTPDAVESPNGHRPDAAYPVVDLTTPKLDRIAADMVTTRETESTSTVISPRSGQWNNGSEWTS